MHRRSRHINPASMGAVVALDVRFISGQANNTTLETWLSRPIASVNATQSAAASRPTYFSNTLPGGNPGLVFDGANDVYELSGSLDLCNGTFTPASVVVAEATAVGDASGVVLYYSTGTATGSSRFATRFVQTSVQSVVFTGRRLDADGGPPVTPSAGSSATPCIAQSRFDYSATRGYCSRNGAAETTITPSAGVAPTTDSLIARVGAVSTSSTRLNGKIGLVVAFKNASAPILERVRHMAGFSFKISTQ